MAYVVSLSNFTPPPRFDGIPFVTARIDEAPTADGPWTTLQEFDLENGPGVVPIGLDNPAAPTERDFTTALASLSPTVGWFRIVYTDTVAGIAYSDPVGPSGYPTTEELVAASTLTELTTASEEEQDAWRESAIAAIEEFCNQSFTAETTTLVLDGQGTHTLHLPRRLVSLTELLVNSYPMTVDDLVISSNGERIHFSPTAGLGYYEQALSEASGERFPSGFGNVSITGTWGWLGVPDAVVQAIRMDMEDTALADANTLSQTVASYRRMGLRDVSQGNLSAAMGNVSPLSARVERILSPYVWHGTMGALA